MPLYDFTQNSGTVVMVPGFVRRPRNRYWGGDITGPPEGTIVMQMVASTQTIFEPTVTTGPVSVVLPLVTSTQTVFDPTVTQDAPTAAAVQLEGGADFLLLESNDKLLVESGSASPLTALSIIGTLGADDIFYVVDDPGGTPLSRKVTAATLTTFILSL